MRRRAPPPAGVSAYIEELRSVGCALHFFVGHQNLQDLVNHSFALNNHIIAGWRRAPPPAGVAAYIEDHRWTAYSSPVFVYRASA